MSRAQAILWLVSSMEYRIQLVFRITILEELLRLDRCQAFPSSCCKSIMRYRWRRKVASGIVRGLLAAGRQISHERYLEQIHNTAWAVKAWVCSCSSRSSRLLKVALKCTKHRSPQTSSNKGRHNMDPLTRKCLITSTLSITLTKAPAK